MRILISGASIAGPVLAYWLSRYGYTVTVVERAPWLRTTGGHAVDLFRPAMDIVEQMGMLARVQAKATGTNRATVFKEGAARPVEVNLGTIYTAVSDRHVEIMRDDLGEILYGAARGDVEYIFGDSITAISEGGEVTFERGEPRRFDLVIGADGLHSNVRRLVFGEESRFSSFLGAYVAVASIPNYLGLDQRTLGYLDVGRVAGAYSAAHLDDARALFLFRTKGLLDYHYRDIPRQKELLRVAFAGMRGEVPRWLDELDRAPAFYFDSITQLRMDTWSHGRVTLVGDAAYCPGPVVGGSTSMAVVGAYILAGELAEAGGDHERAFATYEREIGDYVRGSRAFALHTARTLIPAHRAQVWALIQGVRLISHLPPGLARALAKLDTKGVRLHDSVVLKDYTRT